MEKTEDGGPAFPVDERDANGQFRQNFGLTKRDSFAAAALTGWVMALSIRRSDSGYTDQGASVEAARLAVISADAMLSMLKQSAQTETGESK